MNLSGEIEEIKIVQEDEAEYAAYFIADPRVVGSGSTKDEALEDLHKLTDLNKERLNTDAATKNKPAVLNLKRSVKMRKVKESVKRNTGKLKSKSPKGASKTKSSNVANASRD